MIKFTLTGALTLLVALQLFTGTAAAFQTQGCTDPMALNYNPDATQNDGSCYYETAQIGYEERERLPSQVYETSGLIFWNNKLWTHNDDTDLNIYGFTFDNVNELDILPLEGLVNTDWEELQQDSTHLYMGDIGNNFGNRTDLKFYKIKKASLLDDSDGIEVDSIMFSYEDQEDFNPPGVLKTDFDAEAFLVTEEALFVFTKQWVSKKTAVYRIPNAPGSYVAEKVAEYDVDGLITGLSYLPEYNLIAFTGYHFPEMRLPFLLLLYDFEGDNFFGGNKRFIDMANMYGHQVEAIASLDGLDFFVTNERFSVSGFVIPHRIFRFNLAYFLEGYLSQFDPPETAQHQLPEALPATPKLHHNYPNPFNPSTTITYELGEAGPVRLEVFNTLGERVATLVDGRQQAGQHQLQFDASGLSSGIYFYQLSAGHFRTTQRMTLLK